MVYRDINVDLDRIDLENILCAAPCRGNTLLKQCMGCALHYTEWLAVLAVNIIFMPYHLRSYIYTAFLRDSVPQSECLQGVCAHWNL